MPDKSRQTPSSISRREFLPAGAVALAAGASAPLLSASPAEEYKPLDPSKRLRIGVVGGGFGSGFSWHMHPNCQVTAVADLREDRRKRLMERFDCSNAYEEFHPMLKDAKVDAVAIFTGAPDHVPHCVDVMKSGRHVISAVPAAITLEQCQQLVDAVKETGQTYMMAETSCFRASAMTAHAWRKQGKFGRIYYSDGYYLHDHGSYLKKGTASKRLMEMWIYKGKRTWRYGNSPALYVTHATGPMIYVTGEKLTDVAAIGTPIDHEFYRGDNQYDNPFINITFFHKTSGGNSSRMAVHWWTAAPGREGADFYGTELSFFEPQFGLQGVVRRPGEEPETWKIDDHASTLPPNLRERIARGHGGAEAFIVHEFVTACLEERRPAVDVYQAVAYTAPGIVGQESAMKDGEWMKVPDFGPIS